MNVKDVMSGNVEAIEKKTTLQEAARLMKQRDIGGLPVTENDELVGFLTDRDIVTRGVAEGMDISSAWVDEIMTRDPVTVSSDEPLDAAARLMREHRVRRVIVSDAENAPMGILSLADLATSEVGPERTARVLETVSEQTKEDRC